jgi:Fe-S-cluster containining protein
MMSLPPIEGAPDASGADCVGCGRCCHHPPSTVSLLEHDEARLDPVVLRRLTVIDPRPPHFRFLLHEGGHCIALDEHTPGRHACSIYEVRPDGCRTVEPASPACVEARRLGHLGQSVEFFRA